MIERIKKEFVLFYVDEGPENGILQGTKYAGAATHCRACLKALTRIRRPKHVLEIGSWHYESADAIANAMDEIYGAGHGVIDRFDIRVGGYDGAPNVHPKSPRVNERFWYAFHSNYDDWKYNVPLVYDFKPFSNQDLMQKNLEILQDCTVGFGCYDLIFIDGDHSYEGVNRDFQIASKFANADTLFVLDNIWDIRLKDVRRFYDELPYEKWDFEEWNDAHYGINMVQDTGVFRVDFR